MRNVHASVNAILIKGKVSICCVGACCKVVHTRFLVLVISFAFTSLFWTTPKHLPTSPGIFQNARKIVARGLVENVFGRPIQTFTSSCAVLFVFPASLFASSRSPCSLHPEKDCSAGYSNHHLGSFLESPDNKRSRRAVVVDIQNRGINSFADNMIKLSAGTRAFDLNIWFRVRKVSGTFEKRFPYLFLALLVFSDIISCFKSKKTSIVGWLLLTLRRDRLVNTRSRYSGWRWRQWSKTSQNLFLQLVDCGKNDV